MIRETSFSREECPDFAKGTLASVKAHHDNNQRADLHHFTRFCRSVPLRLPLALQFVTPSQHAPRYQENNIDCCDGCDDRSERGGRKAHTPLGEHLQGKRPLATTSFIGREVILTCISGESIGATSSFSGREGFPIRGESVQSRESACPPHSI